MARNKKLVVWLAFLAILAGTAGAGQYQLVRQRETIMAVTYRQGSQGQEVREIQQRLKDWGYFDGTVDGIFGSQTRNAVIRFQRANGLSADGIVGNSTLEQLGLLRDLSPTGGIVTATEEEIRLLAAAINGEGRGEPYEGQVAIGAVILNRVASPKFPNTISGVIYQRGAFDAVADGQINLTPNSSAFRAARDAVNGWDPTDGALYYWNPATATSQWIWTVPITTRIGRHVFGTK